MGISKRLAAKLEKAPSEWTPIERGTGERLDVHQLWHHHFVEVDWDKNLWRRPTPTIAPNKDCV